MNQENPLDSHNGQVTELIAGILKAAAFTNPDFVKVALGTAYANRKAGNRKTDLIERVLQAIYKDANPEEMLGRDQLQKSAQALIDQNKSSS